MFQAAPYFQNEKCFFKRKGDTSFKACDIFQRGPHLLEAMPDSFEQFQSRGLLDCGRKKTLESLIEAVDIHPASRGVAAHNACFFLLRDRS